jgi:nicotinate dehydrogenase subunit A
MVMTSAALLAHSPNPSVPEIKDALATNLCRCGTHDRIISAVLRASGRARG